jgi:uracil-DNA glycosylase family 4
MIQAPAPAIDPALESLLAFWAEAGVEACYEDAPIDRLAQGAARLAAKAKPPTRLTAAPTALAGVLASTADIGQSVAQAREMAAAAQDLDALVAAIAAFDGCPLKSQGATQAVVWRGAIDAPVMIVGEGPGAEEDRQGEPFVGKAGRLLDRMVAAAGLTGRVFITNTVFWRPPGNRTPTLDEQAVCAPFVERAIELVKPKLLLLAGGASAKSMLKQDQGILSLRGRWLEWRSTDQALAVPAMPTLHPAFLLRQPAAKKNAWIDFLTLAERLDRPEREL